MKFKAEMGHWSSVVGNSVHLIGEDGRFLGQIAIMCQDDRLREKDVQSELCEKICAALNADLCASGQQVRALDVDDLAQIIRVVDGNNTLGAGELAEAILEAMPAPQPSAATPTAQEAVPVGWITQPYPGVKWSFSFHEPKALPEGWIARPLYTHPPQPSKAVSYALLQRAVDLIKGDLTGSEWKRACNAFVKDALRALKGSE